eukprot:g15629.t1
MALTAPDGFILAGVSVFALIATAYIAMTWLMRRNFYILLRSPMLTCTYGLIVVLRYLANVYEYVIIWRGDNIGNYGIPALLGYPTVLTALIALTMTAVRLLVMYYPSQRARWGRYVKEKVLIRALGCSWVLVQVGVWSAAWWVGIPRIASIVATVFRPLAIFGTVVMAAWLVYQLRNVHDSSNLSRDIGLVARVLVAVLVYFALIQAIPMTPVASKYAMFAFLTVSNIPVLYVINIRPVREVLRHLPPDRRTDFQKLLAPRHRRTSGNAMDENSGDGRYSNSQGRAVFVDGNRVATIMSFPSLKKAFGEFCRKALCSESFEFLVDVSKYKAFDRSDEGVSAELSLDHARFLAIVNSYIKHDSHSEINIGSDSKRDIMDYVKFEAFLLLSAKRRKEIFNGAEAEISNLLADNLMSKFLASPEYTEVVDLEND